MSIQGIYSRGSWNTICDVCGRQYKANDLRKRWDNLMVCNQDFEERQPQDFVRGVADTQAVPWARPEGTDTFVPINYTTTIDETNTLSEILSKNVAKIVPDDPVYAPDLATDEGLGLSFLGKYSLAGTGVEVGSSHTMVLSETVSVLFTRYLDIAETVTLSETVSPVLLVNRSIGSTVLGSTTLG